MGLFRRSRRSHREEIAQDALARGSVVEQGAELSGRTLPASLVAELNEAVACEQTVTGPGGIFVAEWWSNRSRDVGSPFAGPGSGQHLVRVPTRFAGQLLVSRLPDQLTQQLTPRIFAGRPLRLDSLWVAGDAGAWARAEPALRPWLPWVQRFQGLVVVADGQVVLTHRGEPDRARFEEQVASARGIAASLDEV